MLLRRNTKAFKTILEIVTACQNRPDREKLIRLYITRAGHSINDRIGVEGIQGEASIFYDMNYHAVLTNLESSTHQLHHSDEVPGIYFFHSNANKTWDQTPFEFDDAIKKEFTSLPELPATRKKEKQEKFVFPSGKTTTEPRPQTRSMPKEKTKPRKTIKTTDDAPKQPNYNLKHKIKFTGLEKILVKQAKLTKKEILDYYNKLAPYILPYLKDRPLLIRLHSDVGKTAEYSTAEDLASVVSGDLPEWLQTVPFKEGGKQNHLLICNDKEHLLFYVEIGCVQFNVGHSRVKSLEYPDYLVIAIDPPDTAPDKGNQVIHAAKDIIAGLQLPSFVKSDGASGLHLYIPLDGKSKFETSKSAAEYICKLIRLKVPDLISLDGSDEYSYGKVSLVYQINEERKSVVAPYSIVPAHAAQVATPFLWEEMEQVPATEDLNYKTILKKLSNDDDPFLNLLKKKINADTLLERLEKNYAFLF